MNQQGRDLFVVEARGDLMFEVERDENGTYRVTSGFFDWRSSEDQLSVLVFQLQPDGTDVDVVGTESEEIVLSVPGKGSIVV